VDPPRVGERRPPLVGRQPFPALQHADEPGDLPVPPGEVGDAGLDDPTVQRRVETGRERHPFGEQVEWCADHGPLGGAADLLRQQQVQVEQFGHQLDRFGAGPGKLAAQLADEAAGAGVGSLYEADVKLVRRLLRPHGRPGVKTESSAANPASITRRPAR